jgi:hypothetical protein
MKHFFIILIILTVLSSYGQTEKKNVAKDIKGSWYLNKWTSYHTLIIRDSSIFIDNSVDTVFTIYYSLSDDSLITWRIPDKKFANKIISITPDSLVIDGILGDKLKRKYSKKNKLDE